MFSTCPVACVGQTDPDAAIVVNTYTDPVLFKTSGLKGKPQAVVTNYALNPSAESTGAIVWGSNTAFGAYVAGTTSKVAPPFALERPNAIRLSTPALAVGQKTNITAPITVPVAGVWEFSVWVYVPAATAMSVRAVNIFGGGGPYTAVTDKWIRLTKRENIAAGDHWMGIDTEPVSSAKGAGLFIYADAFQLKFIATEEGADFQGVLSTSVDGWHGANVFGNFTPPQSIQTVAFSSPSAGSGTNPRSLRVQWKSVLDPGSNTHVVMAPVPLNPVIGEVYTYECDIYVPAGSPDIKSDVLFNGDGGTYTTKGAWTHVRHTFLNDGFSQFDLKAVGANPGASAFLYIANFRFNQGYGTKPPLAYFDGTTQDDTTANLAAGVTATAVGTTLTPNVVGPDGRTYTRMTGAGSARVSVPLVSLASGRQYIASWELMNPGATPVSVGVDWNDVTPGNTTRVVQPGETVRVFATGARAYDATFRFTDLAISGTDSILFRDVQVEAWDPWSYAWTGTAEASTSTATSLADDFIFDPSANDSTLYGPVEDGVCDDVSVSWVLSSPSGIVFDVQVGWATAGGVVTELGPRTSIGPVPSEVRLVAQSTPNFPDQWRPVLISYNVNFPTNVGHQVRVHSMSVSHRPILSVEECVSPYRRTLHNVVTVSGPTVVEWLTLGTETDGSTVARVEWTWVATDPHQWHDPIPLLTTVQGKGSGPAAYNAPGVPLSAAANSPVNTTACARPAATALTCADNALGPGIILPPQAPVIVDTSIMNLAGTNRTRRTFEVPVEASPIGLGKFSWKFVNDGFPKFGIRVRIWNDTQPGFLPETECGFAEEFTIEYLGANQTLYIDGPGNDAYVYCGLDTLGQPIYAPALKNLRGNYGGPFKNSWIGCGQPYYIAVDVPNNYTTVPSNLSGLGTAGQGDVVWSVELVRRG